MKNLVKYILQKVLGYRNYLVRFSKYKIKRLKSDKKEGDFFTFMDQIKGDGLILDVGANIGIMTYHLSKRFPEKEIMAIEPIPSNFDVLEQIVTDYKLSNVRLTQVAVGEENGEVEMVLPLNGKVVMQGLAHVVHDSITEWNKGETFKIDCVRLDDIVKDNKVAGIKMDIENFEYFALKGANEILKRDKPVVYLELWPNDNRSNCFELLLSLGYRTYVNDTNKLVEYLPGEHQQQNFIFLND